ncbi:MAG TPA: hypothetical protein ENK05_08460 [Gammaproteobacteria bacterium]|nr:hypothetical protein [Gammaproteobacteria bacterium]
MKSKTGKVNNRPLLRGLERRATGCRRKQARRKSDEAVSSPTPESLAEDLHVLSDVLREAPYNVVIADQEQRLVFVNRCASETLRRLEEELECRRPDSRGQELVTGSVLRYHNDTNGIQRALRELGRGERHSGRVSPGAFCFHYEIRALFDLRDRRIGYVLHWHDLSSLARVERQVNNLIRLRFPR